MLRTSLLRGLLRSKSTQLAQTQALASAPELPPCDFVPEKYSGPSHDQMAKIRADHINPGIMAYYRKPISICQGETATGIYITVTTVRGVFNVGCWLPSYHIQLADEQLRNLAVILFPYVFHFSVSQPFRLWYSFTLYSRLPAMQISEYSSKEIVHW